jgi:sigma-B regulation protein RsbU (phosphoserine phosphatase)
MISKEALLGVIYIDTQSRLVSYNKDDLTLLNSIASQAAVSISNARMHSKIVEQKQVENELEIAHSIQRNLLPKEMPSIDGFEAAALCKPAKHVGGDYYDFIPLENDCLGIAIADVSGKGVPAAILSSSVRAALQVETRYSQHSISDMIQKINTMAWRDTTSSMFLSMVYGVLDAPERNFTYVNAGHNYPMLFLPDGSRIDLDVGGTLLGVAEDITYQQGSVDLPKGSVLVIYTDGVIDIQNEDGESMGLTELTAFIESHLDLSADDLIQKIYEYAFRFKGAADPYDDFTLIVLKSV